METKDIIRQLRSKQGLSQEELAQRTHVTRQAVSRWETGETLPNPQTLTVLSKLFDVSVNTLLGAPRTLICQCCGMPMEDGILSREPDGSRNENYCQWCYHDGSFVYDSQEQLMEYLVAHMSSDQFPPEQARAYFSQLLPQLQHWKK